MLLIFCILYYLCTTSSHQDVVMRLIDLQLPTFWYVAMNSVVDLMKSCHGDNDIRGCFVVRLAESKLRFQQQYIPIDFCVFFPILCRVVNPIRSLIDTFLAFRNIKMDFFTPRYVKIKTVKLYSYCNRQKKKLITLKNRNSIF